MATFQISVLGPVGVTRDGVDVELGDRLRRLLGALVTSSGSVVSTDRLAEVVWVGDPPDGAAKTLRSYMTRLRRSIGADRDDVIVHRQPGYAIVLGPDELDSSVFEREVDEAARRLRTGDASEARALLASAIGRWRGRAFAGFADEEWARPESVRLEERLVEARELRLDALLAEGDVERAVAEARALVEAEPLRERPRSALLRALYASGRQAEALRVADAYRQHLADETGLDPSVEFVELESRVVRGDRALGGPVEHLRGYELAERIGEGAFSVVHRGVQPGLERDVAIKIIRPELADRPDFIRRFDVEARTIARIEHPNVVPLFDYWREPGAAYLVMRLLRGGTVEAALRARGPYGREQALALLDDVGAALAEAHRLGVVHRDVRPANLLLDEQGTAYLADFGIALPTLVSDDVPIVSPAYAAPEVLRGEPAGVAADVLSLSVTVFELLTGRLPFADSHDRAELIRRQLSEPLPPVRATRTDLPARLDDVLARATAKAAADRHQSVAALVDDLHQALAGDSAWTALVAGPADGPVANPYVGLLAFDEMDADRFFGRSAVVAEVIEAMVEHPMVTVVGPSGAGKSSIVRAGVLPAIRRGGIVGSDRWFVTTMLPGRDPIEALEAALLRVAVNPPASLREQLAEDGGLLRAVRRVLPDDGTRILLVVDQFEELFTQVADPGERDRFLSELAAAVVAPASPLKIVATLRADHYDAPLRHRTMAQLVTVGVVSVHPMSPAELERAIAGPAEQVGVKVEPALVAELVAEVDGHPAALPLLQFSLTELFDRRVAGLMQLSTHRDLGGLTGALAARADRIVEAGGSADEVEVRRIFGRLVTLGEGTENARRRAVRSELGDGERTAWLLDKFVAARLLATDHDDSSREPTIEVAHEALLRDWPRLRGWLADDRADLTVLRAVSDHAAAWEASGHDDGELARGGRLELASDLEERQPDWLTDAEREWLAASREAAERRREAEAAAAERDRRQNRRLRALLVAAACLLALAVIAAAFALVLRDRSVESERVAAASRDLALANERAAEDNAREAETAREDAEIERLVALSAAEIVVSPDRAILLALEANRRRDDVLTQTAIHRAIAAEPRRVAVFPAVADGVTVTAFSSDGSTGLSWSSAADGGTLFWFDVTDGVVTRTDATTYGVDSAVVAHDGSFAVVAGTDEQLRRIRPDGSVERYDIGNRIPAMELAEDDSGLLLQSGGVVEVLDPSTWTLRLSFELPVEWAGRDLAISPNGERVVVLWQSPGFVNGVDVLDVATGSRVARIAQAGVELQGGEAATVVDDATTFINAVEITDDQTVLLGHDDGEVQVWRVGDTDPPRTIGAHGASVTLVSAIDGIVYTAGGNEVRSWLMTGGPADAPMSVPGDLRGITPGPSGAMVFDYFGDRGFDLVDPDDAVTVDAWWPAELNSIAPGAQVFATPTGRTTMELRSLADGSVVRTLDSEEFPGRPPWPSWGGAPFYSWDGQWVFLYDATLGSNAVAEVYGERVFTIDGDLVELVTGEPGQDDVIGIPRPIDEGRLYFASRRSDGQWAAAHLDPATSELVAGPVELPSGGRTLIFDGGRAALGAFEGAGGITLVGSDLAVDSIVTIDGTEGMLPLAHDPSSDRLLVGRQDGFVGVLDLGSFDVRPFAGAPGVVGDGAFSPDGRRAAVQSFGVGIQFYDIDTGQRLGVPMGTGAAGSSSGSGIHWSKDGSGVWWAPLGGPQRLIADPQRWREVACEIVHRELSTEEWATFVSPDTEPVSACPDA